MVFKILDICRRARVQIKTHALLFKNALPSAIPTIPTTYSQGFQALNTFDALL